MVRATRSSSRRCLSPVSVGNAQHSGTLQENKINQIQPEEFRGPPTIYRHHESLWIKKGISRGVVYELSEPNRTAKCIPPPGLHWRCSSWVLWGWCADCGFRELKAILFFIARRAAKYRGLWALWAQKPTKSSETSSQASRPRLPHTIVPRKSTESRKTRVKDRLIEFSGFFRTPGREAWEGFSEIDRVHAKGAVLCERTCFCHQAPSERLL